MQLLPPTFIQAAAKRYMTSIVHPPSSALYNPDGTVVGRLLPAHIRATAWLLGHLLRAFPSLHVFLTERFPPLRLGSMTARTRFLDRSVAAAVAAGASQVVILGAGLDTRARRMRAQLADVRVFELDLPPTQAYKRRALRQCGWLPGWGATFVCADLSTPQWPDALRAVGCDLSAHRTHVVWEGCTYYLTARDVAETLRLLKVPGVTVSFDFVDGAVIESDGATAGDAQYYVKGARLLKEPWLFGIDFHRLHEWAANQGWEIVDSVRGTDEARDRFFPEAVGCHSPFSFWGLATIRPA